MAICIATLEAMAAAGATVDVVIAAVKAQVSAESTRIEERRRKDAERQKKSRASRRIHVTPRDTADADQPAASSTPRAPQDDVLASSSLRSENESASEQKEKSPRTPLKEKHHTQGTLGLNIEGREDITGDARARGRRAYRLPPDWSPSLDDLRFARELLPAATVQLEVEKFRDHWHASNGPPKRDWSAAWRTWCRNAVDFNQRRNGNGHGYPRKGSGPHSHAANIAVELAGGAAGAYFDDG